MRSEAEVREMLLNIQREKIGAEALFEVYDLGYATPELEALSQDIANLNQAEFLLEVVLGERERPDVE